MPTTIYGTSGADDIFGTDGADDIFAGSGNDWINGGLGVDYIYGDGGDDVIWFDEVRVDNIARPFGFIDGGAGYDLIDLSGISPGYLFYDDTEQSVSVGSQGFDFVGVEEIWFNDADNSLEDDLGITAAVSPLAVYLGGGNDYAALAGAITINGEAGNDSFFLSGVQDAGFLVSATVFGGTGTDTVRLNIGFTVDLAAGTADSFDSRYFLDGVENIEAVADTVDANSTWVYGNDAANKMSVWYDTTTAPNDVGVVFYGYGGADSLSGSRGRDILIGGSGNDLISGFAGNDTLKGDAGDDRLYGDSGSDLVQGGIGRDVMTGGTGADRFVFTTLLDSGRTGALADRITDFTRAQSDKIQLTAIDAVAGGADNAFTFIGTGAFTGTAGQLRYAFDTAGTTLVEMDVDGNGLADMAIRLDGQVPLTASDFLL